MTLQNDIILVLNIVKHNKTVFIIKKIFLNSKK